MIFRVLLAVVFAALAIGGAILGGVKLWEASEIDTGMDWRDSADVAKAKQAQAIAEKKQKKGFGTISMILASAFLIAFIIVPWNFHQVETGEVAVVRHMGKVEGVRESGVHTDFWMTNKYETYDTKVRSVTSTTMAYSNDKQTMDIEMTVQYQIDKSHVMDIATTYGSLEALESRISSVVIERTKSVLSKYNADSIISERAAVSATVAETVEEAIGTQYYIDVTNVSLTNIDFSDAYEASVEQSMIAKQDVEKAKAEAEKLLVEAENKVKIAQAEANAKKAAAEGEAEAVKIQAEADAEALKTIQAAWDAISPEVKEIMLREMAIEKWNGELPDTMVGSEFIEQLLGALGTANP